jgi:hypothetical protein
MENKTIILLIGILLVSAAAADVEFRDSNPVDFFTNISMNGERITGLADGTGSQDAVTVSQLGSSTVDITGDIMQGDLDMDGNDVLNVNNMTMDSGESCIGKYC